MANYFGLWYGGANYATPDPDRDGERFTSIRAAGDRLRALVDNDDGRTPCVDKTAELQLYAGGQYHENGPDRVLTIGRRGGVVVSRG
jgi:hypothetical protein